MIVPMYLSPCSGLFLANAGVFTYFGQSNFAGKVIVLALLAFSLLAWTVMIGKYLELTRARSLNGNFEHHLARESWALGVDLRHIAPGPHMHLVLAAQNAYRKSEGRGIGPIENALARVVAQQTAAYESKMVLLGSIVTGAPFLGLLGTVWGVMDAFGAMALQNTATLQNLAPGVSGALLTTVAGLLVAIPSVFGYNFLLTQTKQMVIELENFASSFADRVEHELVQAPESVAS